jgi:hypothetical protein
MSDDPKRIVEHGYNAIADRYAEWARTEVTGSPAVDYLERLLAPVAAGRGRSRARLRKRGHEVVCQNEGEHGEACFLWVLARRS